MSLINTQHIDFGVQVRSAVSPKTIVVTDLTDKDLIGTSATDFHAAIKATAPDGTVFYLADVTSDPDITHVTPSSDLTQDIGAVLSSGKYLTGDWEFDYTWLIPLFDFDATIVAVDLAANRVYVQGDIAGAFGDSQGGVTVNGDTVNLTAVVYDPGIDRTFLEFSSGEHLVTGSDIGTLVSVEQAVNATGVKSKTVTLTATDVTKYEPKLSISIDYSCKEATLTSSLDTEFEEYTSRTIRHSVFHPKGIVGGPSDVEDENAVEWVITHPDLYTGMYTTIVEVDLVYDLGDGASFSTTLKGTDHKEVVCNDLFCTISCGIEKLRALYESYVAKGDNATVYGMHQKILQIELALTEYQAKIACGDDVAAGKIGLSIISMLEGCGCSCSDCGSDSDDMPTQVVPVLPITKSMQVLTTPTQIVFGSGVPTPIYNNGDIYFNIQPGGDYGSLYQQVGGAMVKKGVLRGNDGVNGANGATGTPGLDAGIRYTFSDITTDADPGSGKIRYNAATPGATSEIYIDYDSESGGNMTGLLDFIKDIANGSTKAILYINNYLKDKHHSFNVLSVVDGTGYYKLTVENLAFDGAFVDSEALSITFSPSGSDGADGVDGTALTNSWLNNFITGLEAGKTSSSTAITRYQVSGKTAFINGSLQFTMGGTPYNNIKISSPIANAVVTSANAFALPANNITDGVSVPVVIAPITDATYQFELTTMLGGDTFGNAKTYMVNFTAVIELS